MDHIEQLIPQILQIAKNAGKVILTVYEEYKNSKDIPITRKPDGSPLTSADFAAHQVIYDGLHQLTPNIPIISEEDSTSHTQAFQYEEFWLVDPLDGTKEFIKYTDEFTVNIAFIRKGQPIWGVVYAPALQQMYWGGKKMGSRYESKNVSKKISISKYAESDSPIYRVIVSKSYFNEETKKFLAKLGKIELVQTGSSLKFCRVAEGNADIYPRLGPTYEWDTAAAQAVVEGAQGMVIDFSGKTLCYGKKQMLNPHFLVTAINLARLKLC